LLDYLIRLDSKRKNTIRTALKIKLLVAKASSKNLLGLLTGPLVNVPLLDFWSGVDVGIIVSKRLHSSGIVGMLSDNRVTYLYRRRVKSSGCWLVWPGLNWALISHWV